MRAREIEREFVVVVVVCELLAWLSTIYLSVYSFVYHHE